MIKKTKSRQKLKKKRFVVRIYPCLVKKIDMFVMNPIFNNSTMV